MQRPSATLADDLSFSVVILAPRGRDALVASQMFDGVKLKCVVASGLTELALMIEHCIGVALITEEALFAADEGRLIEALSAQPAWSDVPFVVLANRAVRDRSTAAKARMDRLRNVVLLSRPLHAEELLRAVRSALKARTRQYEARDRMSELQLRELQLRESESKFHAIADSVDQMIWSTRPDGFHDYYNRRWYEFTGVPHGSTDGEGWANVFHPDDHERSWERWRQSLATGEQYEIEYRLRHHSGEYRWVLGRAKAAMDEAGRITRWYGTCTDINRIKTADAQRELMLGEMNHRVKNSMAMVHSIVSQSLRQAQNLDDARVSIQSRIGMMAQAHDRLVKATWTETRISDVVAAALAPHGAAEARFTLAGPDLSIGSKQALALTMALHELATNAVKYGALSTDTGDVDVRWQTELRQKNEIFRFSWQERGGPKVEPPERVGFGSRMIEQALAGYFNGEAELDYRPNGLVFELVAPIDGLAAGD